jgi:hypothetical protein
MSNHFISIGEAKAMTALYRSRKEDILDPAYQDKGILSLSESFDGNSFNLLLAQTGAAGLRFYFGMSTDLQIHIIAVATDASGNDIIPAAVGADGMTGLLEYGIRCPPTCPPPPGSGL